MLIRDLKAADLPAMAEIYNDAVVNTTSIWNDALVDVDNRRAFVGMRRELGFPVIVAEVDGEVAAYATFGDFRSFAGYRHTVEHSIYVDKRFRRRGIARALLNSLEAEARLRAKHVMLGGISADNEASLKLHADLGFREVARMPEVGRKFDRWLDLVFMQKILR
ncbi:MAG: GNAT family N-acetyltransferase [Ancalomicrobiaceae bacterium]|nr:GNAT family N-acetyltransferase [Ancalomicrobiaceae bacterium]